MAFVTLPAAIVPGKSGAGDNKFFFIRSKHINTCQVYWQGYRKPAHYTDDAIGGLLNATFGNLPELIICIITVRPGVGMTPAIISVFLVAVMGEAAEDISAFAMGITTGSTIQIAIL